MPDPAARLSPRTPMRVCRLIQDPARDGGLNMAIDEALLRHADQSGIPSTTLRLYGWIRPTVSLGYAQRAGEAADLKYCASRNIGIVRRPTGGRAVLHAEELTYAVVSNDHELFGGSDIRAAYLAIADLLREALQSIGCPAEVSPGTVHRGRGSERAGGASGPRAEPCFQSTSRFELTAGGRKLVGSAQRRLKHAFLQHGSILIRCNYEVQAAALGADTAALRNSFTSIVEQAAEQTAGSEYEEALRRAIPRAAEQRLAAQFIESGLLQEESLAALHYEQMGRHRVSG